MFEKKKKKCQHNINKPNTTVKLLDNFKTMVVPDTKYGVCVCCGKSFEFDSNNKIIRKGGRSNVNDRGDKRQAE